MEDADTPETKNKNSPRVVSSAWAGLRTRCAHLARGPLPGTHVRHKRQMGMEAEMKTLGETQPQDTPPSLTRSFCR